MLITSWSRCRCPCRSLQADQQTPVLITEAVKQAKVKFVSKPRYIHTLFARLGHISRGDPYVSHWGEGVPVWILLIECYMARFQPN